MTWLKMTWLKMTWLKKRKVMLFFLFLASLGWFRLRHWEELGWVMTNDSSWLMTHHDSSWLMTHDSSWLMTHDSSWNFFSKREKFFFQKGKNFFFKNFFRKIFSKKKKFFFFKNFFENFFFSKFFFGPKITLKGKKNFSKIFKKISKNRFFCVFSRLRPPGTLKFWLLMHSGKTHFLTKWRHPTPTHLRVLALFTFFDFSRKRYVRSKKL